jgi:hypothetical protein
MQAADTLRVVADECVRRENGLCQHSGIWGNPGSHGELQLTDREIKRLARISTHQIESRFGQREAMTVQQETTCRLSRCIDRTTCHSIRAKSTAWCWIGSLKGPMAFLLRHRTIQPSASARGAAFSRE